MLTNYWVLLPYGPVELDQLLVPNNGIIKRYLIELVFSRPVLHLQVNKHLFRVVCPKISQVSFKVHLQPNLHLTAFVLEVM